MDARPVPTKGGLRSREGQAKGAKGLELNDRQAILPGGHTEKALRAGISIAEEKRGISNVSAPKKSP